MFGNNNSGSPKKRDSLTRSFLDGTKYLFGLGKSKTKQKEESTIKSPEEILVTRASVVANTKKHAEEVMVRRASEAIDCNERQSIYNFKRSPRQGYSDKAALAALSEDDLNGSEFPNFGLKLSEFDQFITECGRENLKNKTTNQVNLEFLKPMTSLSQSSYCDYVLSKNPKSSTVAKAQVFVSHAWNYQFLDVVDALKHHFRENRDIYVWFDLFSNNQHNLGDVKGFDWWANTFKSAIAQIGHTVVVLAPWIDPEPLKRAWCLYELYCTVETNSKFEVAMTLVEQEKFIESIQTDFDSINKMLATIDAERSSSHRIEDRDKIFEVVRETVGFGYINSVVFEQLREWVIDTALQSLHQANTDEKLLNIQSALGNLYSGQGRYMEAEFYFSQCFELKKTLLGDQNISTLSTAQDLASALENLDREEEANELYEYCLDGLSSVTGEQLHSVETSLYALCAALCEKGHCLANAEPFMKHCIASCEAAKGERHADTLRAYMNLASVYRNELRFSDAEPLLSRCLGLSREALGGEHPETLACAASLGCVLEALGRREEARAVLEACLAKQRVKLGDFHPHTLDTTESLIGVYLEQGALQLARPLALSLEQSFAHKFGATSAQAVGARLTLARLVERAAEGEGERKPEKKAELDLAQKLYIDCIFADATPAADLSDLAGLLAGLSLTAGQGESARLPLLRMDALCALGCLLYARAKHAQAALCLRTCLEGRARTLGCAHKSSLLALKNLGTVLRAQGREGGAREAYLGHLAAIESEKAHACAQARESEREPTDYDAALAQLNKEMKSF